MADTRPRLARAAPSLSQQRALPGAGRGLTFFSEACGAPPPRLKSAVRTVEAAARSQHQAAFSAAARPWQQKTAPPGAAWRGGACTHVGSQPLGVPRAEGNGDHSGIAAVGAIAGAAAPASQTMQPEARVAHGQRAVVSCRVVPYRVVPCRSAPPRPAPYRNPAQLRAQTPAPPAGAPPPVTAKPRPAPCGAVAAAAPECMAIVPAPRAAGYVPYAMYKARQPRAIASSGESESSDGEDGPLELTGRGDEREAGLRRAAADKVATPPRSWRWPTS